MSGVLTILKLIFAPAKILSAIRSAGQFFIKHWKATLIVVVALFIFHQNFMETELLKWAGIRTVPGLEHDIAKLQQKLDACEISREVLKNKITDVNNQVDQWANLSHQLQNQHTQLVTKLQDMQKKSDAAVQNILNGPTPETCEAAIEFLKEAASGDLKWKK